MQWLNKVDEALESALHPTRRRQNHPQNQHFPLFPTLPNSLQASSDSPFSSSSSSSSLVIQLQQPHEEAGTATATLGEEEKENEEESLETAQTIIKPLIMQQQSPQEEPERGNHHSQRYPISLLKSSFSSSSSLSKAEEEESKSIDCRRSTSPSPSAVQDPSIAARNMIHHNDDDNDKEEENTNCAVTSTAEPVPAIPFQPPTSSIITTPKGHTTVAATGVVRQTTMLTMTPIHSHRDGTIRPVSGVSSKRAAPGRIKRQLPQHYRVPLTTTTKSSSSSSSYSSSSSSSSSSSTTKSSCINGNDGSVQCSSSTGSNRSSMSQAAPLELPPSPSLPLPSPSSLVVDLVDHTLHLHNNGNHHHHHHHSSKERVDEAIHDVTQTRNGNDNGMYPYTHTHDIYPTELQQQHQQDNSPSPQPSSSPRFVPKAEPSPLSQNISTNSGTETAIEEEVKEEEEEEVKEEEVNEEEGDDESIENNHDSSRSVVESLESAIHASATTASTTTTSTTSALLPLFSNNDERVVRPSHWNASFVTLDTVAREDKNNNVDHYCVNEVVHENEEEIDHDDDDDNDDYYDDEDGDNDIEFKVNEQNLTLNFQYVTASTTPNSIGTPFTEAAIINDANGKPSPETTITLTKEQDIMGVSTAAQQQLQQKEQHNCYGVFHVRILRAQRLTCSAGTTVHASISLLPWEGKIRTSTAVTFLNPATQKEHGVCIRWGEETPIVSLLHNYSSEETPVPTLQIDLVHFSLMFESTLCSLEVSGHALMASPNVTQRQWFVAKTTNVYSKNALATTACCALIELEAVFEPATETAMETVENVIEEAENCCYESVDLSRSRLPMDSIEMGSIEACAEEDEDVVSLLAPSVIPSHSRLDKDNITTEVWDDRDSRSVFSYSQRSNSRGDGRPLSYNPHMLTLRLGQHWVPAVCCVCKRSIMSGLTKTRSFRCEVCKIDCCSDCRLQVDIKLPCGSDIAERARTSVIQNRFTVKNIMNVIAPPAEPVLGKNEVVSALDTRIHSDTSISTLGQASEQRIGIMTFEFARALIFGNPLPPETDPISAHSDEAASLKRGDYYIRVVASANSDSKRTRTMQNTGRPIFDKGSEMKFSVPHYGTEFRIELTDASTNNPIGFGVVTTQSLLIQQRELFIAKHGIPILSPFSGPPKLEARHFVLEFRSGLKSNADFFASSKSITTTHGKKHQIGNIVATVELTAQMEEDAASLFGENPYACPSPSSDELNLASFGLFLERLLSLVDDIRDLLAFCRFVVSWRNPWITAASFAFFTYSCFHFDTEFLGSIPLSIFLLWMLYFAVARWKGRLKKTLIDKKDLAYAESIQITGGQTIHRPMGVISIGIKSGRNIRSADLGLPGLSSCRVYWDPSRFNQSISSKTATFDKSSAAAHDIGSTSYVYATNPSWEKVIPSDEAKRFNNLFLSSDSSDFFAHWGTDQVTGNVKFPVVQPISQARDGETLVLEPWTASDGAIVFEVKFQDTISLLPGSEYSLGEVVCPFSKVVEHETLSGWFQVLEVGSTRLAALGSEEIEKADSPMIHIEVKWISPSPLHGDPSETDREASLAVQEELIRSARIAKENKLGFFVSSMSAINNVRGLNNTLLMIQNVLGLILNTIGMVRSAIDFSDPYRSSILFWTCVALWILLAVIPTRFVVFVVGLAVYGATFLSRFGYLFRSENSDSKDKNNQSSEPMVGSPYATWILNGIRGLPTDEDVRKSYFWESRRYLVHKRSELAEVKRRTRLDRLWKAQFYSELSFLSLERNGDMRRSNFFAVMQGHRFLWWCNLEAFDDGDEPLGLLFLSGHAGLSTPSPLELKCIDAEELPRVTSIFGKGKEHQERLTIVTPSVETKEHLEYAVSFAIMEKED